MSTLGEIGEFEAIRRIMPLLGTHPDLTVGAGDDCAVCTFPGSAADQVFTTDAVIENAHFLPREKPERIGNKAIGRSLSDIAAMGARPQWILVNVTAPPEYEIRRLEKIYRSMTALCNRFNATIIGGDFSRGSLLELHVFATGWLPCGTARLRCGAKAEDVIFTTGVLGNSIKGHHLDFVPRIEEGWFLRENGWVNAMTDISDGLAANLYRILECSNAGAVLQAESVPKAGTLEQALYDGEDYELLFTVAYGNADRLQSVWSKNFGNNTLLHRIGTVTRRPGILQITSQQGKTETLEGRAFEHFLNRIPS